MSHDYFRDYLESFNMPDHITDGPTDPDDRPEYSDEEVWDALTQNDFDGLIEILYQFSRTMDELKDYPFARKQA